MCFSVNLFTQDFFCTSHSQCRNLCTQTFFGTVYFLIDFSFGTGNNAITFSFGICLGFINDLSGAFFGLPNDLTCLLFGLVQCGFRFFGGHFEGTSAFLGSSQTICDFFLACFDRF